jgi:hypothetical protein
MRMKRREAKKRKRWREEEEMRAIRSEVEGRKMEWMDRKRSADETTAEWKCKRAIDQT